MTKYYEPDEKVKMYNYEMGNVVNCDGSTEWKTFLDVRKSFVSLVFSPISPIFADFHAENVKKV